MYIYIWFHIEFNFWCGSQQPLYSARNSLNFWLLICFKCLRILVSSQNN